MEIDDSELRSLVAVFERAQEGSLKVVRPVIKRGAQNIKTEWSGNLAASRSFRGIAQSVTYDMSGNAFYSEAEIGPDKGRGGALANIAHFGGANGGGGSVDLDGPLTNETPKLMKALDEALTGLL